MLVALDYFNKVIEAHCSSNKGYSEKAECLFFLGNYEGALANWNIALTFEPNSINNMNWKGFLLEKMGRKKESLDTYQIVLSIEPDNQYAKDGVKRISQ